MNLWTGITMLGIAAAMIWGGAPIKMASIRASCGSTQRWSFTRRSFWHLPRWAPLPSSARFGSKPKESNIEHCCILRPRLLSIHLDPDLLRLVVCVLPWRCIEASTKPSSKPTTT